MTMRAMQPHPALISHWQASVILLSNAKRRTQCCSNGKRSKRRRQMAHALLSVCAHFTRRDGRLQILVRVADRFSPGLDDLKLLHLLLYCHIDYCHCFSHRFDQIRSYYISLNSLYSFIPSLQDCVKLPHCSSIHAWCLSVF